MLKILGEIIQFASHCVFFPFLLFLWEASGMSLHKGCHQHKGLRERGGVASPPSLSHHLSWSSRAKLKSHHCILRPSRSAKVLQRHTVFLCILCSDFFQLTTYCTMGKFQQFRLRFTWISCVFIKQQGVGTFCYHSRRGTLVDKRKAQPCRAHPHHPVVTVIAVSGEPFSHSWPSRVLPSLELYQHCLFRLCCVCITLQCLPSFHSPAFHGAWLNYIKMTLDCRKFSMALVT